MGKTLRPCPFCGRPMDASRHLCVFCAQHSQHSDPGAQTVIDPKMTAEAPSSWVERLSRISWSNSRVYSVLAGVFVASWLLPALLQADFGCGKPRTASPQEMQPPLSPAQLQQQQLAAKKARREQERQDRLKQEAEARDLAAAVRTVESQHRKDEKATAAERKRALAAARRQAANTTTPNSSQSIQPANAAALAANVEVNSPIAKPDLLGVRVWYRVVNNNDVPVRVLLTPEVVLTSGETRDGGWMNYDGVTVGPHRVQGGSIYVKLESREALSIASATVHLDSISQSN